MQYFPFECYISINADYVIWFPTISFTTYPSFLGK